MAAFKLLLTKKPLPARLSVSGLALLKQRREWQNSNAEMPRQGEEDAPMALHLAMAMAMILYADLSLMSL